MKHADRTRVSSISVITLGFLAMLALLVGLAAIGLRNVAEIQQRLEATVSVQNVKAGLVWELRDAARERSISLLRMSLLRDPFDIDEEIQRLSALARDFITAFFIWVSLRT